MTPLLAHLILIPVKQGLRDFVFLGNVLRTTLALAWQNFHVRGAGTGSNTVDRKCAPDGKRGINDAR